MKISCHIMVYTLPPKYIVLKSLKQNYMEMNLTTDNLMKRLCIEMLVRV